MYALVGFLCEIVILVHGHEQGKNGVIILYQVQFSINNQTDLHLNQ